MLLKNYNWKKHAGQVLQNEQVEKAFMDQAYGFIQNKAGKLMESPHKLGFEIVHKNDANTRMVGIFAFRIQNDLLYVPVFFLNGEIKGTDLLYRHTTKTFVPLNEDWVTFLFEKAEEQPGEGIDRAVTKRTPGDIEMRRIAYPPDSYYSRKNASEKLAKVDTVGAVDAKHKQEAAAMSGTVVDAENAASAAKLSGKVVDNAEPIVKQQSSVKQAFGVGYAPGSSFNAPTEGFAQAVKGIPISSKTEFNPELFDKAVADGTISPDIAKTITDRRNAGTLSPEDQEEFRDIIKQFLKDTEHMGIVKQQSSADWLDYWSEQTKPEKCLREFMEDCGDSAMLDKLAAWCEESYDFANSLFVNCEKEDYMPEGMVDRVRTEAMDKQAAEKEAAPKPLLTLHTGFHEGIKSASEEFFKKGYVMEDNRDPGKLSVVYEDNSSYANTVTEPGIYEVIMKNGDTEECLCAPYIDERFQCADGLEPGIEGPSIPTCDSQYAMSHNPEIIAISLDSRKCGKQRGAVGNMKEMLNQALDNDGLIEKQMATGKTYRILDLNSFGLTRMIHVLDSEVRDGLIVYTILQDKWGGKPTKLMYNPNFVHTDFRSGVIGPAAVFVRVEAPKPKEDGNDYYSWDCDNESCCIALGNQQNLDNWIFGHTRPFGVIKKGSDYMFRYGHKRYSSNMDKIAAMVHLTKDLQVSAGDAESMLEKTSDWHLGVWQSVKKAAVIRMIDTEDFQPSFNQDFGVTEDRPHFQALETDYDFDEVPLSRKGDAYDPGQGVSPMRDSREGHPGEGLPTHVLMSASPEELAQMAQNVPQVFEHGVVGSLATTFDSMAMIDKYLPKLEEAVDSMGRALFLYYWKPGDFQDSYGADDMVNLENELLSNFKSLGDLTLGLLKKNQYRHGSVPMHS
jgi:hypothetical protein